MTCEKGAIVKTCADCGVEYPTSSYRADGRTKDGLSRRCNACRKAARKERREARKVSVFSPRKAREKSGDRAAPQAPVIAPGPTISADPYKYARSISAPYTVTFTALRGALAVSVDRLACSRSCADAVLEKYAPPVRSHVHWDARGQGHRAIQRPVRVRVGPAEREGRCEACGTEVRSVPRRPATDLQTVGASVETSAWV